MRNYNDIFYASRTTGIIESEQVGMELKYYEQ